MSWLSDLQHKGIELFDGFVQGINNAGNAAAEWIEDRAKDVGRYFSNDPNVFNISDTWNSAKEGFQNSAVVRWIDNAFTGNRDYQRQIDLMDHQAEINNAAAEKDFANSMEASSTAYQRAAADLKAAGLNPALALGASASAPTMSTSSVGLNSAGRSGDRALDAIIRIAGALIASHTSIVNNAATNARAMSVASAGANNAALYAEAARNKYFAEQAALAAVRGYHSRR